MIKTGRVELGKTRSELSSEPAEVLVNGVPMTHKEASKKKNREYTDSHKNIRVPVNGTVDNR